MLQRTFSDQLFFARRIEDMTSLIRIGSIAMALAAMPLAAEAGKVEGAGIGAGAGAVVAGPVGAVVGGVVGYNVGGPDIITTRSYRSCWRDDRGRRHCARRSY
jgi:outer membrane lipoprotein SlyB